MSPSGSGYFGVQLRDPPRAPGRSNGSSSGNDSAAASRRSVSSPKWRWSSRLARKRTSSASTRSSTACVAGEHRRAPRPACAIPRECPARSPGGAGAAASPGAWPASSPARPRGGWRPGAPAAPPGRGASLSSRRRSSPGRQRRRRAPAWSRTMAPPYHSRGKRRPSRPRTSPRRRAASATARSSWAKPSSIR